MISHHLDQTMLLDYASGGMSHSLSLITATHLALCPACRRDVEALEAVGGAMLDETVGGEIRGNAFEDLMARIEAGAGQVSVPQTAQPTGVEIDHLPRPLRDHIPLHNGKLRWGRQGPIETIFLPCDDPGHRVRLLRIAPGKGAPQHSHRGLELTLVLQGSFHDETGQFGPGDIEVADPDLDHRPIADEGVPCLCLAVTTAPLRLTGPLGRLIDPFLTI